MKLAYKFAFAAVATTAIPMLAAYVQPVVTTLTGATEGTVTASSAAAQTAVQVTPSAVHIGTEIYTATDHGGGESANYDYVIGDGTDVKLLGIYGNASLNNARIDSNDREFLFSISSANNAGSAILAGPPYSPSHHSADPAIFAGILKQAGGNNATLPINVTFPNGGLLLSRGAVRISAITGIYDAKNGFEAISTNEIGVLSSELHVTFIYSK